MRFATPLALLALALPAAAAPPNPCEILSVESVNSISARQADRVKAGTSGSAVQCTYLSGNTAALVVSLKEVLSAPKDTFDIERMNNEKISRIRAKMNETVGDGAYWLSDIKTFSFRKGNIIGTVKFENPKNQNELDSSQIARLVEAKLK